MSRLISQALSESQLKAAEPTVANDVKNLDKAVTVDTSVLVVFLILSVLFVLGGFAIKYLR